MEDSPAHFEAVSIASFDAASSNVINGSIYGDDESLLPVTSSVDEADNFENGSYQNSNTAESELEMSSVKLIYDEDNDNNDDNGNTGEALGVSPADDITPASDKHNFVYEEYKLACQNGDLEKVKTLIETKAIDYLNDTDPSLNDNITGLHWASINNRLSIVKYLTNLPGYNITAVSCDASKTTALHWAAKYGYTYIIKELAAKGADIYLPDSQGLNILHLATLSSNILTVIYVLVNFPELDINAQDADGRTAIMWACYQGDNLTVSTFLKLADKDNSLSLNVKDKKGFNCLHWAIVKGDINVLTSIIKKINTSIKSYLFEEFEMDGSLKNCHIIAKEMNTEKALEGALLKNGYDYNGDTLVSRSLVGSFFEINYISNTIKNNVGPFFFIMPFIQLGIFNKLGDVANPVLLLLLIQPLLMAVFGFIYLKVMLPLYLTNPGLTLKTQITKLVNSTPLLSGVLCSTIAWGIYLHFTRIFYYAFSEMDFFYFIRSTLVIYWLLPYILYKLMFVIDPGYCSVDDSKDSVKHHVDQLMESGQYNLRHFNINTFQPTILRSRFVHRNERLVNRFDHFCIWIYNDVGLNNHKFFIYFLITLLYAVSLIVEGSVGYFEYLEDNYQYAECVLIGDDKLCAAFQKDSFMLYNVIWMCMQGFWVFFLLLAQLFMVSKGFTTIEFEQIKHRFSRKTNRSCIENNQCFEDSVTESEYGAIDSLPDSNYDITEQEFRDFETAPRDFFKRSQVYANDTNYQLERLIFKNQAYFFKNIHNRNNNRFLKITSFFRKHKFLAGILRSSGISNVLLFISIVYYSYNGPVTKLSIYDFGILQNFKDFFLNTDSKAPIWSRLISENLDPKKSLLDGTVVDFDTFYEYSEECRVALLDVSSEEAQFMDAEAV